MAGTASAQPITMQFKFKSNVNGVYGIGAEQRGSTALRRHITVADANEHEYS
jgi:hypothetical protein